MRQRGQRGGAYEARIEPDIYGLDDRRDVGCALAEPMQDGRLASLPMPDVILHEARRLVHRAAVTGQIERLAAAGELFQRSHVIAHGAVGRRHDRGRPRHHMVAGEQEIGFLECVRHVVGRVSGRRHRFHGPAGAADLFAVGERDIGAEIHVGAGVEPARLADVQRTRQAVGALRINLGAGCGLDLGHGGGMIAVGVGDENVGDGLPAHGVEQRADMRVVIGAGVEDRDLAAADDVADRALIGERAGIVGDDGAHARRHLLRLARLRDRKSCRTGCRRSCGGSYAEFSNSSFRGAAKRRARIHTRERWGYRFRARGRRPRPGMTVKKCILTCLTCSLAQPKLEPDRVEQGITLPELRLRQQLRKAPPVWGIADQGHMA